MTDYKNPVPEDRTIVNGIWSDVLDKWLNDNVNNEGNEALQIALLASIKSGIVINNELLETGLIELKKLVSMYSEINDLEITSEDVDDGNN